MYTHKRYVVKLIIIVRVIQETTPSLFSYYILEKASVF
jgi:hypothetical protein